MQLATLVWKISPNPDTFIEWLNPRIPMNILSWWFPPDVWNYDCYDIFIHLQFCITYHNNPLVFILVFSYSELVGTWISSDTQNSRKSGLMLLKIFTAISNRNNSPCRCVSIFNRNRLLFFNLMVYHNPSILITIHLLACRYIIFQISGSFFSQKFIL